MVASALLALTASLLATSVFAAPASSTSSSAQITSFVLNGSGCPPGTSSTRLSSDNSTIVASFSAFSPSVTSANPTSSRQNCQAVISVSVPIGQQFTLDGVKYDGFLQLQPAVTATHQSTYYFQAQVDQNTASSTQKGPIVKEVQFTDSFSDSTPIYSACGGTSIINVNIAVALDNTLASAAGFAEIDTAQIGPFKWQSC